MFDFLRKIKLDPEVEKQIVAAIANAEKDTRAELRVHLSKKIRKSALEDATHVFKKLGMHKTELRSGILIYVIPSEQQFAILGDVGIHEKVTHEFWDSVSQKMTEGFATGNIENGIITGIQLAGEKLKEYYPWHGQNPNEISNEISRG
ncbi:MAG: TPM domain-containing protein [Bacteroidia bacterium]|nr:TPM domain-containing protein [Bacteroidia bacterium]